MLLSCLLIINLFLIISEKAAHSIVQPFFAQNIHYFCGILEHSYGIRQKHGYLIQWLIGMGDLVVLNLLFFAVYYGLGEFYTKAISYSLREVVLLLNFCYFFALYFVPMQLHVAVVFIDKIVQRAFALVSIFVFLFATCLIFLNIGDALATFLLVYFAVTVIILLFGECLFVLH